MSAPRPLPLVPGRPLVGNLPELRRDPIGLMLRGVAQHGDIVVFPVANRRLTVLRSPEHVKHVLVDQVKNYSKQTRGYDALRLVLGQGLVTSEGDFWRRQRRLAQPGFHRQKIVRFADTMVQLTAELFPRWDAAAARGEPLDVAHEMMALTLRVVGRTLLSTEVSEDADAVGRSLTVMLRQVIHRTMGWLNLPRSWPTPTNRELDRAKATLDGVVLRMIAERRRTGEDQGDLLSMLISARDEETGEAMTDAQLRDEVMTIFLAGHETTANALSWTFALLSGNPDVRRKLEAELQAVLPGGRLPTLEDLPRLRYTGMVISESMRLYPPVWTLVRRAEEDDLIDGVPIPKHSFVAVAPIVCHRNPKIFENPEGFDPERFAPERAAAIPRYAYLPFSTGPRQCIGNTFALMEAQLALAALASRYRLDLVPGHPVVPEPTVTLRPKHGLHMFVKRISHPETAGA